MPFPAIAMPCHGVLCSSRVSKSGFVQELFRERHFVTIELAELMSERLAELPKRGDVYYFCGGAGIAWNAPCTIVFLRESGFLSIPLMFQPPKAISKTPTFREAKIAPKLPGGEN